MSINTKRVKRREVRYETLDDAVADMNELAALERDNKLEQLGNWSLGQAIGHVATWAEFAFEPNPLPSPPWFVRMLMPLLRSRFLNKGMPAGVAIPGVEGGTIGTEPMPTFAAIERFTAVAERLKREAPTQPSPAFGMMSKSDGTKLQLRHAELHMSFFKRKE
jgi:hypothetical protein